MDRHRNMRAETKEMNVEGGRGRGWIGVAGVRDEEWMWWMSDTVMLWTEGRVSLCDGSVAGFEMVDERDWMKGMDV